jgi:LemA protein
LVTILILSAAIIVVWIVFTYNLFVRDKNLIKEAWSGIDVQLKRRHNLIPNLVESVKGYSSHERNLFEEITKKRAEASKVESIKDKAPAESDLSGMLKNLFVVAENYPKSESEFS